MTKPLYHDFADYDYFQYGIETHEDGFIPLIYTYSDHSSKSISIDVILVPSKMPNNHISGDYVLIKIVFYNEEEAKEWVSEPLVITDAIVHYQELLKAIDKSKDLLSENTFTTLEAIANDYSLSYA